MANTEKENEKGKTLEENFQELEEILQKMDDRELPLEESFLLYQRGIHVLQDANKSIDRVEKEVLKLNGDGSLSPLDSAE